MCGIVGFCGYGFKDTHRDVRASLMDMSRSLIHRGPDDDGSWFEADEICGFGHRRLSIVDLSSGGHQPMVSHDGRYILVFNGEVYNHRELRADLDASDDRHHWRGTSDTETLLATIAQWGMEEALKRADGMFAIALWDRCAKTLKLARDRVGEKPLFYWNAGRFLVFASEIKALLALPDAPRRLDRDGLASYLSYGYVPGVHSLIKGIQRVPPATVVTYVAGIGQQEHQRYWELPESASCGDGGPSDLELIEMLRQKLVRAVRMQLQADVPVAALLSGGVDSSLVTAFAAEAVSQVRTFTIGFPKGGALDETAHAGIVARHFGTDHTEIPLESLALDALETISQMQDEPLCDSSILPTYLVCRAVSRHVKVALGGDGGDELFGGYRAYNYAMLQDLIRAGVPRFARSVVADTIRRRAPLGMKGRAYLAALGHSKSGSASRSLVLFDENERRQLLEDDFANDAFSPESWKEVYVLPSHSVIQTATRMDFHTYLPDDILAKVDRASMMSALEVRAPMLDRQVVEFAFGQVPDRLKAGYRQRKILLRKLAERVLPTELNLRRKQGFSIPLKAWLQTSKGSVLIEAVKALPPNMVRRDYVDKLVLAQQGGGNNAERIFCLAMLSFWMERFRIQTS
jgi:asparagine synthase (glutamine-hydrolysing)